MRLVLLVVLLGLAFTGVGLDVTKNTPSTSTTTTPSTSTVLTTTTTTPTGLTTSTTTTTTTTAPPTSTQLPISDPLTLNEPARGCGFVMTPGSGATTTTTAPPVTTTTSTATTTTTSSSTSSGAPPTTTLPPNGVVPVRAIGHCTVLEVGDSLGNDLGWGLAREVTSSSGLDLVQKDKSASGLVASWFYNWPQHLKTFLAQYHPDLVIVCVGGDDQQGLVVNGHADGFGSPQWLARYRVLVRHVDTMITQSNSYVLWVGLPVMQPPLYNRGAAQLNTVYRSVGGTVPGVTFLPLWDEFANAQGQYESSAVVNRVSTLLRASDGIHFSYEGENVLGTFVVNEIASSYHVRVAPIQPALIGS